jgi:L-alanine-DL-glutamate epimerase-like enolase superfamily enzyme
VKIIGIETIRLKEFPNILFLEVHTDEGISGLGETFYGAAAVEAYLHESVAGLLIGEEASDVERHRASLRGTIWRSFGIGVESRGNSAVNIALWDLIGKRQNRPIYDVLGGATRDEVRIYNTCAGYRYVREPPLTQTSNWSLPTDHPSGPFEDLDSFLFRADELAQSLLDQGINGMKIWPFDEFAKDTGGCGISAKSLELALDPIRKIRDAVGLEMDVMIELHSLWDLPSAYAIAQSLEEFSPLWIEDPMPCNNIAALARLAKSTTIPLALSETIGSVEAYVSVISEGAAQYIIVDASWAGGISESLRIATVADAYHLPVTFHDCSGPISLVVASHLAMHIPNVYLQETVRAYYTGWYRELVTNLPSISNGWLRAPLGPGLGTELTPGIRSRPDAIVQLSGATAP